MVRDIKCEDCDSAFKHDEEKQGVIKCPICKAEVHHFVVHISAGENDPNPIVLDGGTDTKSNHQILYEDASRLFRREEYTVSVIIAHTACEVATARTLHHAMRFNNLNKYYDVAIKSRRSTHITSSEILKWYKVLTNDDSIAQQAFWKKLKEFADLRNKIIHEGERANKEQAQEALDVVIELFKHFNNQRRKFSNVTDDN